jgi:FkbM family methyltransferase
MFIKKRLETIFHNVIRKTGYDVIKCKYSKHELEIEQLLNYLNITCVLDIGANEGQYAKNIRIGGYKNRIISFEPIKEPFTKLQQISANDSRWDVYNIALGNFDGKTEINIAGNSQSSSILEMNDTHLNAAPKSKYIGSEVIEIRTMDSLFKELNLADQKLFMKIDTQGFEKSVLLGAKSILKSIKAIQLEMAVQTLYIGEDLYYQLSEYLYNEGFRLIKILRGLTKSDGELLQFDGVFMRD